VIMLSVDILQGAPGGQVSILGGHSSSHSKQKSVYVRVLFPNGFRDRAVSLYTVQTSNTPCPDTSCKVH
jgi:hypothetical protein